MSISSTKSWEPKKAIRPMDDMVRPKNNDFWPASTSWKVTARYTVKVSATETLECIRVRCGLGPVLHFSLSEFRRLFSPSE